MKKKIAIIFGVTGQDGYYLTKLLIKKNYVIHGIKRRSSSVPTKRIDKFLNQKNFHVHYGDLTDTASIHNLIKIIKPDEIYNLAAQSHVSVSFKNPVYTTQVGTLGSLAILEAIRHHKKDIRFYQASSSEMYGGASKEMLNEESQFDPKSPYAASKVFAHNMTSIYRESYDMFCVNGILFNHESPMRGETFVTRKITRAVGRIKLGLQSKLTLGNLEASRDWGFSGDYVDGMWRMLQHDKPDDFVLATGKSITVKEFAELAFENQGLNYEDYVTTSQRYYRPNEVDYLLGDYSKAKSELDWKPKTNIKQLVDMMVEEDLLLAKREKVLISEGLLKPTWEHSL